MLTAWVLLPLLLAALCLGCGLAVEALARRPLPGALLPGVGLAAIVVVGGLLTLADATAELTTPAVVVLAIVGGLLGWRRVRRPNGWAIAAVAAVFVIYAAPVVLSGEATLAGYIKLDDTATWLAITDRVMEHGRSIDGLAPSTYEATLALNLGDGYPVGAFLPLGVAGKLVGTDIAWLIHPYMAFLAAVLALALWQLARAVVAGARRRAAIAFVAAQPALLYGYYLWGGVKEVLAGTLVATGVAVLAGGMSVPSRRRKRDRPAHAPSISYSWPTADPELRAVVPVCVIAAALIGVLSAPGVAWLAPALVAALALVARARGPRRAAALGGGFVLLTAFLALPALLPGLTPPTSSPLTDSEAIGNLAGPLDPLQVAGIWPAGDFRFAADAPALTDAAIGLALIGAAVGLGVAWRRRAWAVLAFCAGGLVIAGGIAIAGSPWVEGKAFAMASVVVPFAAGLGAAALWAPNGDAQKTSDYPAQCGHRWLRAVAVVLGLTLAGGILWSNALAYRDVNLAPRDQLAELEEIGKRIAGEGPTLTTEYSPYGARHFLRDADPESVSELRRREIPLRGGEAVRRGLAADTDELSASSLLIYRTLVLHRSPALSRPPSPYRLIWRGETYEVWQRPPGTAPRVRRVPLGSPFDPTGVARCGRVRALARSAGAGDALLAAHRPPPIVVSLADAEYPDAWRGAAPGLPIPIDGGTLTAAVEIPDAGRYALWLRGSIKSEARLLIDGEEIARVRRVLNNQGQYIGFGSARLTGGRHQIELRVQGADLHPGSGGQLTPIGPLVLSRGEAHDARINRVPPSDAGRLCGGRYDWVEAVSIP